MMDMFPMNNVMNLKIQVVREPQMKVFQIKQNKVVFQWIHNIDGEQQIPLTWIVLKNLKSRHSTRFLGQNLNNFVVLGNKDLD